MDKKTYEIISKQTQDPIIKRRKCKRTWQDFAIFQWDIELLEKISPKIWWKKYNLPLPNLTRQERRRRRLMRRNDRKLYRATCNINHKPIITIYHPKMKFDIVENQEWFKSVDNSNHWISFDTSKAFGEQLSNLNKKTSKQNVLTTGLMENSTYTHNVWDMKNCYMSFDAGMSEKTFYTVRCSNSKITFDSLEVNQWEIIFDSISVTKSQNLFYSQNVQDSSYGAFLYNCIGCHNCIGCSNLINKNYHILNKPVSKKEFDSIWNIIFDWTRKSKEIFEKDYKKLLLQTPQKNMNQTNSENSVSHNIINCKDIFLSQDMISTENARYCDRLVTYWKSSDIMDVSSWAGNMNNCYELNCCWSDDKTTATNCHFGSYLFWWVNNTQYSLHIPSMSNRLFGCADIDKKEYHILNKKYSKDEYEKLVPKIIEHMKKNWERWEFLDPKYSPFPYNDTIANDYYPIHTIQYPNWKKEILDPKGTGNIFIHEPEKTISKAALDLWWSQKIETKRRTKEQEVNIPKWLDKINWIDLPKNIKDVWDDILSKAIICTISQRPFRIIKSELEFYRKYKLPLPIHHPDIRHLDRLNKTVFFDIHLRDCDKCSIKMLSVYPNDYEWKVYCEYCYNKEIYW